MRTLRGLENARSPTFEGRHKPPRHLYVVIDNRRGLNPLLTLLWALLAVCSDATWPGHRLYMKCTRPSPEDSTRCRLKRLLTTVSTANSPNRRSRGLRTSSRFRGSSAQGVFVSRVHFPRRLSPYPLPLLRAIMPGSQNTITLPKGPIPPSYWTDDRGHILITVGIVFMVIEIVAFGLRMFACRLRRAKFSWDDVLVISALLSNLAMVAMMIGECVYTAGSLQARADPPDTPSISIPRRNRPAYACGFHARQRYEVPRPDWVNHRARSIRRGQHHVESDHPTPVPPHLHHTRSDALDYVSSSRRYHTTCHCCHFLAHLPMLANRGDVGHACAREVSRHCCVVQVVLPSERHHGSGHAGVANAEDLDAESLMEDEVRYNAHATPGNDVSFTSSSCHRVDLTPRSGIVASTIRAVEFFHDSDKMFGDPAWYMLDLMTYTIAEPGTLFLAACFSTYKPLGRFFTGQKMRSLLSRFRVVSPRYATRLESPDFRPDDSKERKQGAGKPVRGFDSFILSEIEREESTHGSARSERVV